MTHGTGGSSTKGSRVDPLQAPPRPKRCVMARHNVEIKVESGAGSHNYGSIGYDWACLRPKRDAPPSPAKLGWFSRQGQFTITFANGSPLVGSHRISSHPVPGGKPTDHETDPIEFSPDPTPGCNHYRVELPIHAQPSPPHACPS